MNTNFSKEEIASYNNAIKTGKKYEEDGKFTKAIEEYEKALVIHPTNIKIASRISKLMNTIQTEKEKTVLQNVSTNVTKTVEKSIKLTSLINEESPSENSINSKSIVNTPTDTQEDDDIVLKNKIMSSEVKNQKVAEQQQQRSVSVTTDSTVHDDKSYNVPQNSTNSVDIVTPSSPVVFSTSTRTVVSSPSSPDNDTGYSIAELRNIILQRKTINQSTTNDINNNNNSNSTHSNTSSCTATTAPPETTDKVSCSTTGTIDTVSVSSPLPLPLPTTESFSSPSVPTVIDSYTITSNNKWALLPGNYKLPYKLFSQLYSYQRQGVAWMWSLHANCPIASGTIGRESEFSSSANTVTHDTTVSYASKTTILNDYGPKKLSGGILADDMGLGKTVQVVSFISGLFHSEKAETALIVLPVSLISVWENEFQRFAPAVRVFTIHEIPDIKRRERIVRQCIQEGGVILTTYGTVSSRPHVFGAEVQVSRKNNEAEPEEEEEGSEKEDEEETNEEDGEQTNDYYDEDGDDHASNTDEDGTISLGKLKGKSKKSATSMTNKRKGKITKPVKAKKGSSSKSNNVNETTTTVPSISVVWDIMVLDEGHKIKNPSTLAAKALRAIPSRYRLLLSGTPIQNNMDELWSLFDFTHCGKLLDTRRRFNSMIGDRIVKARDKKATAAERRDGALAMKELITIITPYMLRREKEKLLRKNDKTDPTVDESSSSTSASSDDQGLNHPSPPNSSSLFSLSSTSRPVSGLAHTAMGKMGIKKEIILWTNLSSQQSTLYNQGLTTGLIDDILEGKKESFILAVIANLKKIACHPKLLKSQFLQYKNSLTNPGDTVIDDTTTIVSSLEKDTSLSMDDEEMVEGKDTLSTETKIPLDSMQTSTSVATAPTTSTTTSTEESDTKDNEWWNPSYLPEPSVLIQESEKLRLLVLLLRLMAKEGHKVLVFSQSTRMLDILQLVTRQLYTVIIPNMPDIHTWDNNKPCEEFCTKVGGGSKDQPNGLRSRRIDGTMKQSERAEAVDRFNNDPSVAVCFLTTGVGSLGLTLTAATCVIIFDVSWNPAVDAQAVDRAYRVGQTRDVMTFRLISAGTVEEKMYRLQVFKNGLTTTVMNSHGSNGNNQQSAVRLMTKDDLKDLFELGPTTYSKTQSLVDEVLADVPNTPIQSQVINKHLQSLACPPLSEVCVGVSHHDHLFKLAPENIKALVRAAALEAKGVSYKRKQTPNEGNNAIQVTKDGTTMDDTAFITSEMNNLSIEMPLVHPNNEKVIVEEKSEKTGPVINRTTNHTRARNIILDSDDENEPTEGTITTRSSANDSNATRLSILLTNEGTTVKLLPTDDDAEETNETLQDILKKRNNFHGNSNSVSNDITQDESLVTSSSPEICVADETIIVVNEEEETSSKNDNNLETIVVRDDEDDMNGLPSEDVEILSPEAVIHAENVFGTVSPRLSLSHRKSFRGSIRNRTSIGLKYNIEDYEDNVPITDATTDESTLPIIKNLNENDYKDSMDIDSTTSIGRTEASPEPLNYRNQNPSTELYTLIPLLDSVERSKNAESIGLNNTIINDPLVQLRFLHAGFRLGFLTEQEEER